MEQLNINSNQLLIMNFLNELNESGAKINLNKIQSIHNKECMGLVNSLTLNQLKKIRFEIDNLITLKELQTNEWEIM